MGDREKKELIESLNTAVVNSTFLVSDVEKSTSDEKLTRWSAAHLRDKVQSKKQHCSPVIRRTVIAGAILEEFVRALHPLVKAYIEPETECIGIGIDSVTAGIHGQKIFLPETNHGLPIKEFARSLVRASAILGSDRVMKILFGWIEGEPIPYTTNVFLKGPSLDQTIAVEEGIRVAQLPMSPKRAASHLPAFLLDTHGINIFSGGIVLSISCEVVPPLYRPISESMEDSTNLQHTWAGGKIPGLTVDTFCEALSLACDSCVQWTCIWWDIGELWAFDDGAVSLSSVSASRLWDDVVLRKKHLDAARIIHNRRHALDAPPLNIAISRWVKSKQPDADFPDKCIELRIALEALFLPVNSRGNKRSRLATAGARYLSRDLAEQQTYRKQLTGFYDLASKAIHASRIEVEEDNENILAAGQALCRRGIMKMLAQTKVPDWDSFLLGSIPEGAK